MEHIKQTNRKDKGALLIMLALTMSFSIIGAAALSVGIHNFNVKTLSDRSRPLVYEFETLKDKFETALNYTVGGLGPGNDTIIAERFTMLAENFSKIVLTHGYFLNATLNLPISYDDWYITSDPGVTFEDDLLLWMSMDKINASLDPQDNSSYGHNGTRIDGASQIPYGKFGFAFRFDGDKDKINISHIHSDDFNTSAITVTAWIYWPTGVASDIRIVAKEELGSHIGIGIDDSWALVAGTGPYDRLQVHIHTNDGARIGLPTSIEKQLERDTWQFVAFTYAPHPTEPDTKPGNATLYINDTVRHWDAGRGGLMNTTSNVHIGGRGNDEKNFEGMIDEVCIFDRKLTYDEVMALYKGVTPTNYLEHVEAASFMSEFVIFQTNSRIEGELTFVSVG